MTQAPRDGAVPGKGGQEPCEDILGESRHQRRDEEKDLGTASRGGGGKEIGDFGGPTRVCHLSKQTLFIVNAGLSRSHL